jgi:molecular chaperone GrpE
MEGVEMSDQNNQRVDSRHIHSADAAKNEVAGPGGARMPGGEVTPPQNAGAALDESHAQRARTGEVEEQQQAGKIGQQTIHQNPTAGDPENGLPTESPVESESSGVPQNEGSSDGAKKNSDVDMADGVADELAQVKSRLLHLTADFENFKRQAARRETEARERAVRGVLEDLLPVLDNFERAVAAAQNSNDVQSLKTGVEFILQQFEEAIKSHGVEPIAARGQGFDPARHEAIEEIESEQEPGTVVDDVQRGYIYKGNVLRPSRVRVAK